MSGISPLTVSLVIWAVVTGIFTILMIYRSLLSMREDDQLFLDSAESKLEAEQQEILTRITRITPYTKGFGFASAGLLMVSAGIWVYEAMTRFYAP
ncbi:MAG TPA: hypothetical protein VFA33_06765 [Bryobacteraceae bacterium]|nr:hypothetical protein [Bryobacteraceae bacterium]